MEESDGAKFVDLGKFKRVKVCKYKEQVLLDFREYYINKKGEMKPGKKGISLTYDQVSWSRPLHLLYVHAHLLAQWQNVKKNLDSLDEHLNALASST